MWIITGKLFKKLINLFERDFSAKSVGNFDFLILTKKIFIHELVAFLTYSLVITS